MGKGNRLRAARAALAESALRNPVVKKAVETVVHHKVARELSKGSVDDQTGRLNELREQGALPQSNFRDSILNNAPAEMDKGIRKFTKRGKPVTVDTLCAEVRNNQSFLKMCAGVGIDLAWFENLARERMEAHGL